MSPCHSCPSNLHIFDIDFLCRIDELSKLNYAKDVELQSQRAQMEAMQVSVSVYRVLLVVKLQIPGLG